MSFFSFQTVIILIVFTFVIGIVVGAFLLDKGLKEEFPDLYSEFKKNVNQRLMKKEEYSIEDTEDQM